MMLRVSQIVLARRLHVSHLTLHSIILYSVITVSSHIVKSSSDSLLNTVVY